MSVTSRPSLCDELSRRARLLRLGSAATRRVALALLCLPKEADRELSLSTKRASLSRRTGESCSAPREPPPRLARTSARARSLTALTPRRLSPQVRLRPASSRSNEAPLSRAERALAPCPGSALLPAALSPRPLRLSPRQLVFRHKLASTFTLVARSQPGPAPRPINAPAAAPPRQHLLRLAVAQLARPPQHHQAVPPAAHRSQCASYPPSPAPSASPPSRSPRTHPSAPPRTSTSPVAPRLRPPSSLARSSAPPSLQRARSWPPTSRHGRAARSRRWTGRSSMSPSGSVRRPCSLLRSPAMHGVLLTRIHCRRAHNRGRHRVGPGHDDGEHEELLGCGARWCVLPLLRPTAPPLTTVC